MTCSKHISATYSVSPDSIQRVVVVV